jgi:uncharacterized protein (DUF362 family)
MADSERDGMLKRRDFLKRSAGATAVLLAPTVVPGLLQTGCDAAGDEGPAVHAILGAETSEFYTMGQQAALSLGFKGNALAGSTVFIKPNFVALGMEIFGVGFDPTSGECTKPELVVGVAEQCLKAGAAKVTIGEGSQTNEWDWTTVTFIPGNTIGAATELKTAVDQLKATYGDARVELLCTNGADQWVLVPSTSGNAELEDGINVAKAFCEADHIISMPVIKTHQWARLSASMKNYFGMASINLHGNGISRCQLHVAYAEATCYGLANCGVSGSFMDIVKWRMDQGHKDFAIIDGTICLEGSGPHKAPVNDGRTIHMKDRNAAGKYFLLASDDLVSADATVARIINMDVTEIKALQMAANAGMGLIDGVVLKGSTVEALKVADWLVPEMQTEDYFKGFC